MRSKMDSSVEEALVTLRRFVEELKVKLALPVKLPLLLNCTCVSLPPTDALPPSSAAHTTLPLLSVVSVPPFPKDEQSSVAILMPLCVDVAETYRLVVVAFVVVEFVNVALVAVIVFDVRSSMVPSRESIAFDMVPLIVVPDIEPPVIAALLMVPPVMSTPESWSIFCERAI